MKRKKEIYISSKRVEEENPFYYLDERGISLPWENVSIKCLIKKLDFEVRAFCYQDQKDELLILDNSGLIWRYHIGIETLQKTPLHLDKAINMEVIGEIVVVRYIDHIEGYFLANGQRVWQREIIASSLSKYTHKLVEIEEESTEKKILLNGGGESIVTDDPSSFFDADWTGRVWSLESGELSYLIPRRRYKLPYSPKPNPKLIPIVLSSIDSLEYNSRWHRIVLDYDIPDECAIRIEVMAQNQKELKDSSFEPIKNLSRDTLLPDDIQGRYLFVKIYLIPNQTRENSPRLKSLKLIYPRLTYLDHLPAFYQEDNTSTMMLERFFSIFETTFSKLEQKRESTPSLIDTKETSTKNLVWLSSWLGLSYDEHWGEKRWRDLLTEAPRLFDIRGTRESIERVIEIYSGMRPLIQEPMHQRCRDSTDMDNYSFCVFLRPEQYKSIEEVKTIRRIVEEWKPAYTKAKVIPLENQIILGSYLFLEVNTKLTKRATHLGESRLPFIKLAPASEGDMRRVERVSIGEDAILH